MSITAIPQMETLTGRQTAGRASGAWGPCLSAMCPLLVSLPASRIWAGNARFTVSQCVTYRPGGPFRSTFLPSLPCPGRAEKPYLRSACWGLLRIRPEPLLTLLLGGRPGLTVPLLPARWFLPHDALLLGSSNCSSPSSL